MKLLPTMPARPKLPNLPNLPSLPSLPIGPRLGAVLALLLLLTGLGAALSSRQAQAQLQTLALLEQTALPSARLLHELIGHVDELRGLLALHLMLGGTAEATALEQQMQLRGQAIERRLAGFGPRLVDVTERTHFEAVSASLTVFMAEQDKLLAIARRGTQDAATAAAARSQLTGPSQLAYQRLSADLAAWSAYVEQRTDQTSRQARMLGAGLPLQLALLAAALLAGAAGLVAAAWAGACQASASPAPAPRSRDAWADWPRRRRLLDLADTVDRLAFEAHLLALNAAVVAARQGQPEQAPAASGREEGVRHLAQRVAEATREVRRLLAGEPAKGATAPAGGPVASANANANANAAPKVPAA